MSGSHPEPPRDWDAELRAIDRELDRSSGSPVPSPASSAGLLPRRESTGVQRLGTWTRVVLGLLVGIGMTQWPYTHGCGWRLMLYLVAILGVLAAGVWSSLSSWKRRLGVAHVLSQLLIIWGLVLGARAILPRIGYARVSAPWLCPDLPLATGKRAAGPVFRLSTTAAGTGQRPFVSVRTTPDLGLNAVWVGTHVRRVTGVACPPVSRDEAAVARLKGVG